MITKPFKSTTPCFFGMFKLLEKKYPRLLPQLCQSSTACGARVASGVVFFVFYNDDYEFFLSLLPRYVIVQKLLVREALYW